MDHTNYFRDELDRILSYWQDVVYNQDKGLFNGRVDEHDQPDLNVPIGSVMYARILWSFSAAYQITKNPLHLQMADKACQTLMDFFFDREFGGVYWLVDLNGEVLLDKKQIYALAFTIYGLSEYYKVNPDKKIVESAIGLYEVIEKYSFDVERGGYLEAFNRDWSIASDLRLSAKDANEKKTMNTHLHVMEAYSNLYLIWPDEKLKSQIKTLILTFKNQFFNNQAQSFHLFMDEDWTVKSSDISYGHDIEATWLICSAANAIGDTELSEEVNRLALAITNHLLEVFNKDGSLPYGYEPLTNTLVNEKHWWVQAEACVGLLNAWQLSKDEVYLQQFHSNWEFIDRGLIDHENGEWFWGLTSDNHLMKNQDKAGFWKCPYHNTRSLLEIMKRLPAASTYPHKN